MRSPTLTLACIILGYASASFTVTLNNGVAMPSLAFAANVWDATTCVNATSDALAAGFRFVWSSALIGDDCQRAQGNAIAASDLKREEIFVAGTANTQGCANEAACYQATHVAAEAQFKLLNQTVLDMLMLDYPASEDCASIMGQWRAFEDIYSAKRVRVIAVSNFDTDQLRCITSNATATVPAVNQMQYSVGHGSDTVVADDSQLGVMVQAYSPLGSGSLASDPMLKSIGASLGKSAAQVALRWILQRNATVATQSTHLEYLKQDMDVFGWQLSGADMAKLNAHA